MRNGFFNIGDIVKKKDASNRLYIITRYEYEKFFVRTFISVCKGSPTMEKDFYSDEIGLAYAYESDNWVKAVLTFCENSGLSIIDVNNNIAEQLFLETPTVQPKQLKAKSKKRGKFDEDELDDFKEVFDNNKKKINADDVLNKAGFKQDEIQYGSIVKVDEILDALNDLEGLYKAFGDEVYLNTRNTLLKKLKNGEFRIAK